MRGKGTEIGYWLMACVILALYCAGWALIYAYGGIYP